MFHISQESLVGQRKNETPIFIGGNCILHVTAITLDYKIKHIFT